MNWGMRRLSDEAIYGRCDPIPWYCAVAYRDVSRSVFVCYPVPINFIVRWAMLLRYRWAIFRYGEAQWVPVDQITDRLKFEYELGIEIGQSRGYNEGYKAGHDECNAELADLIDTYRERGKDTEGED